jgi:hypothetical protein
MNPISNAERCDDVGARIDQLPAKVDEGFRRVDARLTDHDVHSAEIKKHFTELRAHIDFGLAELWHEMSSGFQRLRKLDQLLDKLV